MADDDDTWCLKNNGSSLKNHSRKRSIGCSCHRRSSPRRRQNHESYLLPSEIVIKILSASYGPCEYNGGSFNRFSPIPSTRDCSSFLLDLLLAARTQEGARLNNDEREQEHHQRRLKYRNQSNRIVRVPPTVDGKIKGFMCLLPGVEKNNGECSSTSVTSTSRQEFVSMNAVFGDPCPGKTKRLEVRYTITEVYTNDSQIISPTLSSPLPCTQTEIHRVSFAEHETVKLRRCLSKMNPINTTGENEEVEKSAGDQFSRGNETAFCVHCSSNLENVFTWKLQQETSEIVLPIVLPFLNLWERMQCRSICRCWKNIVQTCGVSRTIDVNSTEVISRGRLATTSRKSYILTRSMLRGLLAYSYSSLQSLFLSGFGELQKQDLHLALPSLKNLRVLDISYCTHLDDSTLQILSRSDVPSSTSLRVLYLKGLSKITDVGLKAICNSCSQLVVLDLSHLTNLTDEGGRCIQRLIFLRALFLRDNWQLTNESIDAITTTCSKLEQLTLWGCIRLRHLKFDNWKDNGKLANTVTSNRLVILNLWGCHDLDDTAAHVLSGIPNLNCLIVSECHRLTDNFVQTLVEKIGQHKQGKVGLRHLHLRYLKRITDAGVVAIALRLRDLFSLDLAFCSKVTAAGIYRLLDELRDSLVELRLKSCRGLQIGSQSLEGGSRRRTPGRQITSNRTMNSNHAGHWILNALRRRPHSKVDHTLCLLDVTGCGGQPGTDLPYAKEDPFVKGMSALQFVQKVPGFFSRHSHV